MNLPSFCSGIPATTNVINITGIATQLSLPKMLVTSNNDTTNDAIVHTVDITTYKTNRWFELIITSPIVSNRKWLRLLCEFF